MRHCVRNIAIIGVLIAAAATASAQVPLTPTAVDSGQLVRIHTAHSVVLGRLTSRFQVADAALHYCRYPGPPCLGINDSAAVRTMPTTALLRLEVPRGSHWRRGALVGGVFGVGTGYLLLRGFGCADCSPVSTPRAVAGVVLSGLMWGGIGALVGSAFPRWSHGP